MDAIVLADCFQKGTPPYRVPEYYCDVSFAVVAVVFVLGGATVILNWLGRKGVVNQRYGNVVGVATQIYGAVLVLSFIVWSLSSAFR
ncbi:MAG: hypothetical protein JOZ91_08585 [Candidatus Eremiobacteraeota bacterium]|nr:hypothetical protein [Candidatus Eremiobacteraeota bacterium]